MNMQLKIFRASTLADALRQVREELGPDATVLETESRPRGFWGRLLRAKQVEVTAVCESSPSRAAVPPARGASDVSRSPVDRLSETSVRKELMEFHADYRQRFRQFAAAEQPNSLLEAMSGAHQPLSARLPASLFRLYNDLSECDVDEQFAREVVEDVQRHSTPAELSNTHSVKRRAMQSLVNRIRIVPQINQHRERRIVGLIGPTGVGKTTTIAKLAANLRLRDKRRVGLITVDTYRIAAVDQLRAYAQIIDLPMEVVTTPREMRTAIAKLSDVDIILIDTAGRSSHDEIQIQELRALLSEARTDEVHLVLSSVAGSKHLQRLVEQFGPSGPTSLLLTKLDEVTSYGHLLPVLCGALPLSYTTHGQNVPDDIQAANPQMLVESAMSQS